MAQLTQRIHLGECHLHPEVMSQIWAQVDLFAHAKWTLCPLQNWFKTHLTVTRPWFPLFLSLGNGML